MGGSVSRRAACRRLSRFWRACREATTRAASRPNHDRGVLVALHDRVHDVHAEAAEQLERGAHAFPGRLCFPSLAEPRAPPIVCRVAVALRARAHLPLRPSCMPPLLATAPLQQLLRCRQGLPLCAHPPTHQGEARRRCAQAIAATAAASPPPLAAAPLLRAGAARCTRACGRVRVCVPLAAGKFAPSADLSRPHLVPRGVFAPVSPPSLRPPAAAQPCCASWCGGGRTTS